MDILTHTLSGVAIGTVVSSFSTKSFSKRLGIVVVGGIGGMLPDFDAISLWSGFDTTLGRFFNLTHNGKTIYSSKFWYSHHGFLHSITAALIIALLSFLIIYVLKSKFKDLSFNNLKKEFTHKKLLFISFVLGFIIHLLEDMPTPAASWGGVNFFWPSKVYIGGTGDIWWWNNYDIFLIVLGIVLINFSFLILKPLLKFDVRKLTLLVFLSGSLLILFQIKSRKFVFNYSGHTSKYQEFETKSKEIQKQILGEKVYSLMQKFDNSIRVNF